MSDEIILKRDCEAVLIPAGTKITLQAGEPVVITQSLGGSFTVVIHGNMARIDASNADALGQAPTTTTTPAASPTSTEGATVTEDQVMEKLRTCYDPEIPVNIVDLGLVYDCQIQPMPEGGGSRVEVKMTLTAPGCGMGPVLQQDVETKVSAIPGVKEAAVFLVWDPPWSRDMLSETAKLELGLM